MQTYKSSYFNKYSFLFKLLPLLFVCLTTVCCERKQSKQILSINGGNPVSSKAVNINTATVSELETLPAVGEKRARQIIEFREKYGKFLKSEQLILVDGFSDAKFRRLRYLVRVD